MNMHEIIESVLSNSLSLSEHNDWVVKTIKTKFDAKDIAELKQNLLRSEEEARQSTASLENLRIAIMKAVDASSLNKRLLELGDKQKQNLRNEYPDYSDQNLLGVYLYSEFEILCLRFYCLAHFNDGGPNDWFVYYCGAAQVNSAFQEGILLSSSAEKKGPSVADLLFKPYETAMKEIRSKLLTSPVGATFPPFSS